MDAVTKSGLLDLVDQAVVDGWSHRRACSLLELKPSRAWRWRDRRDRDRLTDRRPGGGAVHSLLDEERTRIVELFEQWGETDRSHRKLAHRGSYLGRVWVSPSTLKRVLASQGLHLHGPKRAGKGKRQPFPEWAAYEKNSIWIYDCTHFTRCKTASATAVMDLVTRKWLATIVSAEETSTQVQVVFTHALEAEGMLEAVAARTNLGDGLDLTPILLAVSDNGPQMTSGDTREFMAMCAIAQHFGRPGTPTDQAWIESLFSHVKGDWPHLDKIVDPQMLRAELEIVRKEYNTVRLHAGIGYVTPDDEHEGRGPQIRKARRDGLASARVKRIAYHRSRHQQSGSQNED